MKRNTSDQTDERLTSQDKFTLPARSLSDQPLPSGISSKLIRCRPIGSDSDADNSDSLSDFAAPMARDIEEERQFREANRGKARKKSFKPNRRGTDDPAELTSRDPEAIKALKWRPKEGQPAEHMSASVAALQKKYNPLIKLLGIKIKIIRSDDENYHDSTDEHATDEHEDPKQVPHKSSLRYPELPATESKKLNTDEKNLTLSPQSIYKSNQYDDLSSTASEEDFPKNLPKTDSEVMNTNQNESSSQKPPKESDLDEELSITASEEEYPPKPSKTDADIYVATRTNQGSLMSSDKSPQELNVDQKLSPIHNEKHSPQKPCRGEEIRMENKTSTIQSNLISSRKPPQELDVDEELSTTSEEDSPKIPPRTKSVKRRVRDSDQCNLSPLHNPPHQSDFQKLSSAKKLSRNVSGGHKKICTNQGNAAPEVMNSSDELSVTASEDDAPKKYSKTSASKKCQSELSYPRIQYESRPNFEITDKIQDDIGPLDLDENFELTGSINKFLKPYQRDGVKFLFKHFQLKNGVILGDDMGLGKTIQVISFLSAAMGLKGIPSEKNRRKSAINNLSSHCTYKPSQLGPTCLVICPNSVIDNWANEIKTWGYFEYAIVGGPFSAAETISRFNAGAFDILICGFNYARDHIDDLYDLDFTIVVVDEVQKLKNHRSTITQAFHQFKTNIRFGLTGTAMQNDLMELHSLFNWARPGALGTQRMWKAFVANPILQSRKSNASTYERELGKERATALVNNCWPDLQLRRTKAKILHELPRRTDKIALCPMTAAQKYAYKNILADPDVINMRKNNEPCPCGKTNKSGLRFSRGKCCDQGWVRRIFPYIQVLKKIANHLALTYPNKQDSKEKYEQDQIFIRKMFPNDYLEREYTFSCGYDSKLCGKWIVLRPLLEQWKKEQAQVLLFSQSTKMMDILEHWLEEDFPGFVRLDGDVRTSERFKRVEEFQTDPSKFIFLASTTAAGVGLNLTAANKVVIFDPSWNPSMDAQAMDRVVRIGQKRDVECIRLISLGSTEELIYHRQVYKQHLSEIANTGNAPDRQFAGVQGDKTNQGEIFGVKNIFRDHGGGQSGLQTEQYREEYSYAINQFMVHDTTGNENTEEVTLKPLENLSEYSKLSSNSTGAILRDFGVGHILTHGDVIKTSLKPTRQTERTRSQWKSAEGKTSKTRGKMTRLTTAPPLRGGKLKSKKQDKTSTKRAEEEKNNSFMGSSSSSNSDMSSSMDEFSVKDFAKRNKTS